MKGMLIDVTKCTGCETCVAACSKVNHLKPELPFRRILSDNLSSRRYSTILHIGPERYAKKQCLHCIDPGCMEACLVGAITKSKEGPVIYDKDKCIGCRYCLLSCPMGIPRYEWEELIPYMTKCQMCFERLEKGQIPACVEACPHHASFFGEREELLTQAKKTIKANPKKYLQHVYGEHELGGTNVLYISDVSLEAIGWPSSIGNKEIKNFTWPVLSKTPILAGSVASFLILTHLTIKKRMKLQDERLSEHSETENVKSSETNDNKDSLQD